MDFIDLVIFLLFIVFSVLGSLRKKKGARRLPDDAYEREPVPGQAEPVETDLERALREIRVAMGGEAESPQPIPADAPVSSQPPLPSAERPARPRARVPSSAQAESTGFAAEEAFERARQARSTPPARSHSDRHRRKAAISARSAAVRVAAAPAPSVGKSPKPGAEPTSKRTRSVRGLLRDPESARDAVILAEVLGQRGGRGRAGYRR